MPAWSFQPRQPQPQQPQPKPLPQKPQPRQSHLAVVPHNGPMTNGVMMKTTMQVAILMVEHAATITTMAGLLFARYLTQNLSDPKLAILILFNLVITNFLEHGQKMPNLNLI